MNKKCSYCGDSGVYLEKIVNVSTNRVELLCKSCFEQTTCFSTKGTPMESLAKVYYIGMSTRDLLSSLRILIASHKSISDNENAYDLDDNKVNLDELTKKITYESPSKLSLEELEIGDYVYVCEKEFRDVHLVSSNNCLVDVATGIIKTFGFIEENPSYTLESTNSKNAISDVINEAVRG